MDNDTLSLLSKITKLSTENTNTISLLSDKVFALERKVKDLEALLENRSVLSEEAI